MILGSRNSMTYLQSNFINNLFSFIWRTLNNDIKKLFENGVRCFDLHIIYDNKQWVFANSFIKFKNTDVISVLNQLNSLSVMNNEEVYVNLILETLKYNKKQEDEFIKFCSSLKTKYTDTLKFFGGRRKYDNMQIFIFNYYPQIKYKKHILKNICPKLYNIFHNVYFEINLFNKAIYLIDFC